jgi:7-carboxy-7-deazaguanine synthase
MHLPVNEIFSSVQGEGSFTGSPAVFVRLQFCAVGCPWCDTKHTWTLDKKQEIDFFDMLNKTQDAPTWANVSIDVLFDYLKKQPEKLIVITGGEPCNYDLEELTSRLIEERKNVQIETSGTAEIKADDYTFITLSPKIDMPGGLKILASSVYAANEIKMPVGKMSDVDKLKEFLKNANEVIGKLIIDNKSVYLQPLSQNEKATELCIEQARQNGWRLSAQLHKYLKVR